MKKRISLFLTCGVAFLVLLGQVLAPATARAGGTITLLSAPGLLKVDEVSTALIQVDESLIGTPITIEYLDEGSWLPSDSGMVESGLINLPMTFGMGTPGRYSWRISAEDVVAGPYTTIRGGSITLYSAPGIAPVNTSVNATFRTSGVPAGTRVWTQFLVNGSWSTSQVGVTDGSGMATLPLTYGASTAGAYQWRLAGDGVAPTQAYTLTRTPLAQTISLQSAPGSVPVNTTANAIVKVTGAPVGTVVTIQFLVGSNWSTSRTGSIDSRGLVALPLTYGASTPGSYQWRAVSGSAATRAYTLTRTATSFSLSVISAPGTANTGASVSATIRMSPVKAGTPVALQFLVGGSWKTIRTANISSAGTVSIPLSYGVTTPGTYQWRAASGSVVSATYKLTRVQPVNLRRFGNCAEMRAVHPSGVGRAGAVDLVSGVPRNPQPAFLVHTSLYNLNTHLDRDGDGVACEA